MAPRIPHAAASRLRLDSLNRTAATGWLIPLGPGLCVERQLAELKQNVENWLDLIGSGTARKTGSAESLLEKIGHAEKQGKQIEHELIVLELQQGELEKQVLNAEVTQDSLIRFRDLFDLATDEEKECLFQLMSGRIIWTPEGIKKALYDRPIQGACPSLMMLTRTAILR